MEYLKAFFSGNTNTNQISKLTDLAVNWAYRHGANKIKSKTVSVPENLEYKKTFMPLQNINIIKTKSQVQEVNAVVMWIQTSILDRNYKNYDSYAINYLFSKIISSDFWTELRSKQSLGYVVHLSNYAMGNRNGILLIVQGGKNPKYMHFRVLEYLRYKVPVVLKSYEDENILKAFKSNIAKSLDQPIDTFDKLNNLLWGNVQRSYNFDKKEKLVAAIKDEEGKLDISKFYEFFEAKVLNGESMTVYVDGLKAEEDYDDLMWGEVLLRFLAKFRMFLFLTKTFHESC